VPPPERLQIDDLEDLLLLCRSLGSVEPRPRLWFRGVNNAGHALIPSLYRGAELAADALAKEERMRAQFTSRSMPLLTGPPQNEWGYLFIMQHYGVPTRLLDWSENVFLGLYFALTVSATKGFRTDAALWILDPAGWNAGILPGMDPPGAALNADDSDLRNFAPGREVNQMSSDILAMYARYNNPRITAQRGVFTVFGREKAPMEEVFETKGLEESALKKVVLPRGALRAMYADLRVIGFRESMIYPDLTGLAREISVDEGFGR
jgi:hypothetical protein